MCEVYMWNVWDMKYGNGSVLDTLLENEKKKRVCLWGHACYTHTFFFVCCCNAHFVFAFYGTSYVQICLAMHGFLFSLFLFFTNNFFLFVKIFSPGPGLNLSLLKPLPLQTDH